MRQRIENAINDWIDNHENATKEISFLRYMRDNAMGKDNAKPIETIIDTLRIGMARNTFQHKILSQFRVDGTFFIAWCHKGIYVVTTKDDTKLAVSSYKTRIAAETTNLSNLKSVMSNYNIRIG